MNRAADGQEGDQSPPEATKEIPFHTLGGNRKSRAFLAEFDMMHKYSAIRAHISTVRFVVRASLRPAANECIFPASRYVLRRCVMIFFSLLFLS